MKIHIVNTLLTLFISVNIFAQKSIIINGTVTNNRVSKIAFLTRIVSQKNIDSTNIVNNKFSLRAKVTKSDFYYLSFKNTNIWLVLDPGDSVNIHVDFNNPQAPIIKGSKPLELAYQTYDKMKEFDDKLAKQSEKINNQKKDYIRNFILKNSSSLISLAFLDQLSLDEDIEIYKKIDASLSKKFPNNPMVINLHNTVKSREGLSLGDEAPEINLPNQKGKNIKLSSLRGKYVLIDFWAAWCGPCRRESPNIVATYKKYKKKGFSIYSVSLDKNKADWEKAIAKDGLNKWTHVSDLKFWSSQAVKDYGVDGIPYTVLIDKKGKIIAKGLRGEKLNQKLAEIFK